MCNIVLLVLALVLTSSTFAQTGKPDISLAEAAKVSLFPPTGLSAKRIRAGVLIKWKPSNLERVTGYEIYRLNIKGQYIFIGTVKNPPFVDRKAPVGAATYAVSAIDKAQTSKSQLSAPCVVPPAR